uniref:Uncharacterized protein n=1 Tax=Hyaloperonospora arabidopsidis (strain Emoy2) TaxID=559515 RepID=M4BDL3_HYAAE
MKDYLNNENKLEESRLVLERDLFAAEVRLKERDQESKLKRERAAPLRQLVIAGKSFPEAKEFMDLT